MGRHALQLPGHMPFQGCSGCCEEDATTMTKFFSVRVIAKVLKVIICLFVGNEVTQGDVHEEIDLQWI